MSLIIGPFGLEQLELFTLELGKIAAFDFVYSLAATNINQSAPNLVTVYTTQNLLRITFSFNDLMLKTNQVKKDFFYKDRLIFGLDDPVANMSIRHVYYA